MTTCTAIRPRQRKLALLIIGCLVAAYLLAGWIPTCWAAGDRRPNILLILADDLGYSDLGCYGGEIATPNIDALAAGGLRYTQFYNTARCWPTRASLLTGYYAQQVRRDTLPGGRGNGQGVRPSWAPLLPRRLASVGYRNYHAGKWHIDGSPLEDGFDRSYVIEDHDRHFHPQQHREDDRPLPPVEPESGYYTTRAIGAFAVKCLSEHQRDFADRPFFSYVALTVPHFPLQAPRSVIDRYRHRFDVGWDQIRRDRWLRLREQQLLNCPLAPLEPDIGPPYRFPAALDQLGTAEVDHEVAWRSLTDEQRQFQAAKMAIHAAMVDCLDQEVGRLMDQLRKMDAIENTIVLFLSDNGASAEIMIRGDGHDRQAPPGSGGSFVCLGPGWSRAANTPFRRHKTWVHEGGIATPLVVSWPQKIRSGGRELRHDVGHVIDIVPTLLELADLPAEPFDETAPPLAGHSLVKTFSQSPMARPTPLWWYHEGNRALRSGDWKVVAARGEPWELYDLRTDRSETKNLAAEAPERVRELAAEWETMSEAFSRPAP